MIEVLIRGTSSGNDATLLVQTIDDGWAEELRLRGYDPADYNMLTMRSGATRWNSARVIVQQHDFEIWLFEAALDGEHAKVSLFMDGVEFPNLWVLPPKTTIITHNTGAFLDIELVDERYFWQSVQWDGSQQERGFNVTTGEKDVFYTNTVLLGDTPMTFMDALNQLTNRLNPWAFPGEFGSIDCVDFPDAELCTSAGLRDLLVDGMPVPRIMDRLLMTVGLILIRFNSPLNDDWRYGFWGIHQGAGEIASYLLFHPKDLISGNMWLNPGGVEPGLIQDAWLTGGGFGSGGSPGSGGSQPPGMAQRQLGGGPDDDSTVDVNPNLSRPFSGDEYWWTRVQNRITVTNLVWPQEIAVHFPTADVDEAYEFDKDSTSAGTGYVTRKWHVEYSEFGRNEDIGLGNGVTVPLWDTTWARFSASSLVNQAELTSRADFAAYYYYRRFESGVCDLLFRNIDIARFYVGEQQFWLRSWGPKDQQGTFTRLIGKLHDPLFGWNHEAEPISTFDVLSIGSVRAIPRPDGGILLDAPPVIGGGPADVFMGKIVDCRDGEGPCTQQSFNVTYTIQNLAETLTTPDIGQLPCLHTIDEVRCDGITEVIPYNRFFDDGNSNTPDPVKVDFYAAKLNDWVIVGKVKNEVGGDVGLCCDAPDGPCVFPSGQCSCTNAALCQAGGGTFLGFGECCPDDPPEPAEYAIWIVEDVKISECPAEEPMQAMLDETDILRAHGM